MARVLVVGPNPAWQRVISLQRLEPGEVNRAEASLTLASGKGINAAKVLRRLGHDVEIAQILGGRNGQLCLEACDGLGVRSLHAWVAEETRVCSTLLDQSSHQATEIIEPFFTSSENAGTNLVAALPADPGTYEGILYCGSIPKGLPADLYTAISKRFRPRISLLDAWNSLDEDLLRNITAIKVNRKEYLSLGAGIRNRREPDFLVTDGAKDATINRGGKSILSIRLPKLEGIVNPIGAGDTVSAGTLHFLLSGSSIEAAFGKALAMGSASCLKTAPADFNWTDYESLQSRMALGNGSGVENA